MTMTLTDNWQHRAANMRCKTCMYFVPKAGASPMIPVNAVDQLEYAKGAIIQNANMVDMNGVDLNDAKAVMERMAQHQKERKAHTNLFPGKIIHTEKRQVGRCRRHAPTMNGFPVVFSSDWCGDHKLNETA